jgi:hyperosmotically inducible protein
MKTTNERRLGISAKRFSMIMSLFAVLGLASCQQEGPAEKTGKKLDRSVENAEQKIEQGTEKAESKLDDVKESIIEKTEASGQYIDDSVITLKIKTAILNEPSLKVSQIKVTTADWRSAAEWNG